MIKPILTIIAFLSMFAGLSVSQELPSAMSPPYPRPPPPTMLGEGGPPPLRLIGDRA